MMTLQELELIRHALLHRWLMVAADHAVEIINREIYQMEQDQILSESKANPT